MPTFASSGNSYEIVVEGLNGLGYFLLREQENTFWFSDRKRRKEIACSDFDNE
jgi:hypothetical protein